MSILKVPMELEPLFDADKDNFIRDIANYPQESVMRYFRDSVALYKSIDRKRVNPFNFYTHQFDSGFRALDMRRRYMHFDLSLGGDFCAFAMGSASSFIQVNMVEDGKLVKSTLPYVYIDFVGIMLTVGGGEVWLPEILSIIKHLYNKGFDISLITFDRFQSAYLSQLLQDEGFLTSFLSIDRTSNYPVIDLNREDRIAKKSTEGNYMAGVSSLKDAINQRRISIPLHPNTTKGLTETEFETEARGAEANLSKKKVDHGSDGKIDLIQAVAGVSFNLLNNERQSDLDERDMKEFEDKFYLKLEENENIDRFSIPEREVRNVSYLG